jgi:hypothetical protein
MTSVSEGMTQGSQPTAVFLSGLRLLSSDQAIPFTQYIRNVLPLDGYVFWLAAQQTTITGSLHYQADKQQREDETIAISRIVFTTGVEVQQFAETAPDAIWVGEVGGLKFAFSQRGPFYRASGLYHYSGDAVYPALASQLRDLGAQLSADTLVVSNSLPAWLTLKNYAPEWLIAGNPGITLYPSFAVPDNLPPPYGSVHIYPEQTEPLGAFPVIGFRSSHTQLATDRVRVTLYGATNAQALAFFDLVNQFSADTDTIGMMAPAVVRDEKRPQAELGILAMKKTIDFRISYLQSSILDLARQLIETATATMLPQPYVAI